MIKILSTDQALALRGTIPELAILRSIQFQGAGYSPEEHGHIIVLEAGDDPCHIPEIGPEGLYDPDGLPYFEFVEVFSEAGKEVYEVVIAIDNEKTIAVIIPDAPWLDAKLRRLLRQVDALKPYRYNKNFVGTITCTTSFRYVLVCWYKKWRNICVPTKKINPCSIC